MTLHIFNPGHDEALAAGTPYYTHTRAARALATSLWELPRLWGGQDALVLSPDALRHFSDWDKVERIEPWGWDAALVHHLRMAGAPSRLLPDSDTLDTLRHLSSRETSVRLLATLDKPTCVASAYLQRWNDVIDFAAEHKSVLVKAPWSCSGRGLVHLSTPPSDEERRRVENILRKQGAVAVETYLPRTADFAMEFVAEADGTVRFRGLSCFLTDSDGHYLGNLVASDEDILQRLAPFPFEQVKEQVRRGLERLLAGRYIGPLGVDMLQFRSPEGIALHPCVEINLRHTMGAVALSLLGGLPAGWPAALFSISQAPPTPCGAIRLCGAEGGLSAWLSPAENGHATNA
ncbi:MAG: hypothetical protein IJS89_00640 [Bacteroidaceae bacterium]|nr:hypothetical protein [Bacteroidaceae bacterium]